MASAEKRIQKFSSLEASADRKTLADLDLII